jgi:hypothetical protein
MRVLSSNPHVPLLSDIFVKRSLRFMQLEKCRQINRETGSCGVYSRRRIGKLSIESEVT